MAMRSLSLLLLLMLAASVSISAAHADDEAALLAFKVAAISSGYDNPLASWNGSAGGYCSWEGVRCRGRHRRVVALTLPSHGLNGVLSPAIGNLSSLRTLNLSFNGFSGEIPATIGRLHRLHTLDLGPQQLLWQLEGTIPSSLGDISGIQYLALAFNNLSRELQANMLHGVIPIDIGSRFPRMRTLNLLGNRFTGPIPDSFSNLTTLQVLDLAENRMSGYVPRTLGRLRALQHLLLYKNKLEAGDRVGWEFITSLSNCSQLQFLSLSRNAALTGQLPNSIGNLSKTLQILRFENTGISVSIPSSIGNLVGLQFLGASNNSISGVIPGSIGKLENLVQIGLFNTHLSGPIPPSIGNLSKLILLDAHHAKLEGPIPASLGKLGNLVDLDLSWNHLNGWVPIEIFNLTLLSSFLDLSYNALSGSIPSQVGSLRNLNNMVLSGNRLSGEIPDSIGECTVLQQLQLDNNLFKASIPQSLWDIKGLNTLNLSMNKLSGTIPDGIVSVKNLQQLYLAHNNLSGPIPAVLENMTSLSELDLSFNNLQGEVPKEGIFRNMTKFSITGNSELCGGIPQLHLDQCKNTVKKNRTRRLKYLAVALAYGEGSSVSTLGDVYSLGILLLEMFTGRSPTDDMFRGPLDLHKFAEDAYPDRIWEIVDSTIWLHADTYDNTTRSKTENCLVPIIALGISCSKKQPKERTLIESAAAEMHAIRDSYLIFVRSVAASE
ncbi:hypothetical protein EJB05_56340, partial [Eragrostis curvula]